MVELLTIKKMLTIVNLHYVSYFFMTLTFTINIVYLSLDRYQKNKNILGIQVSKTLA